ncbi:hypothetical protein CIPAW_06G033300 [Carya illinoinensis]|uniref:Uncharacterized protein n=1 Tax=Carya illinoinensis TaxID=32201 RepID=A0A8T1Q7A6_CARIL|nr:hypothetical protein CIPAW_06G033300 [Carya illinoinensis]
MFLMKTTANNDEHLDSLRPAQSIAIGVIVYHAIRTRISALPQDRSLWKLLLDDLLKNSVTNFKNADEFSLNN